MKNITKTCLCKVMACITNPNIRTPMKQSFCHGYWHQAANGQKQQSKHPHNKTISAAAATIILIILPSKEPIDKNCTKKMADPALPPKPAITIPLSQHTCTDPTTKSIPIPKQYHHIYTLTYPSQHRSHNTALLLWCHTHCSTPTSSNRLTDLSWT